VLPRALCGPLRILALYNGTEDKPSWAAMQPVCPVAVAAAAAASVTTTGSSSKEENLNERVKKKHQVPANTDVTCKQPIDEGQPTGLTLQTVGNTLPIDPVGR
jgi:hypothetical protein